MNNRRRNKDKAYWMRITNMLRFLSRNKDIVDDIIRSKVVYEDENGYVRVKDKGVDKMPNDVITN